MKLATRIFRRSDWYVTSPFGWRKDPISGEQKFHSGCDYGTNVQKWGQYALEDGVVESAGKDSSGGIFAWVKYPRLGFRLLHYHLDSLCVRTGQVVNKDTLIGYTGTTGYSTGIHLHLGKKAIGSSTYEDPHPYDYQEAVETTPTPSKTIEELAKEVIRGDWGNGAKRKKRLTDAGYDYNAVQTKVNEILAGGSKPEPVKRTYTVQKGDTLSGIASKYGMNYMDLYNKNKEMIDKENRKRGVNIDKKWLYPNQVINID
jgi:murein DD-endopeptidase MepM/ murein hydrolase activator NlpD